jgi:hypothetical protein
LPGIGGLRCSRLVAEIRRDAIRGHDRSRLLPAGGQDDPQRLYSFSFPYPYPLGWNGGRQVGYLEWQQRVETFKSYEESRLAAACMQEKGYRQDG